MAAALVGDEVIAALPQWLVHRRWFATKFDAIDRIEIVDATALASNMTHVIARVHTADRSDLYQLLLATASPEYADAHVAVDHVIHYGNVVTYEALGDQQLLLSLQKHFLAATTADSLTFHRVDDLKEASTARVISSEQSNSSVIFGEHAIAKFYRRIIPGTNPDLEVGLALDKIGSTHTPHVLGWLAGSVDGVETTLCVMHQFMPTAIDGFEHALSSVRDLIASPGVTPDQAGGDFSGEALRLGEAVAAVHLALAQAFGTSRMSDADADLLVAGMNAKLDQALEIVPQLATHESALRSIFDSIGRVEIPLQRIHGDLHLGQVLRDTSGWIVLDFEGEPGTPLSSRRRVAPAMRDVAGMLRSFDYAARQPLTGHPAAEEHLPRTALWALLNRDAFLRGYLTVAPMDLEHGAALMRALEAEKAVYETVYEQRFRPDWLVVPLGGIERLVEQA